MISNPTVAYVALATWKLKENYVKNYFSCFVIRLLGLNDVKTRNITKRYIIYKVRLCIGMSCKNYDEKKLSKEIIKKSFNILH